MSNVLIMEEVQPNTPQLFNDVCQIIDGTRTRIATTVNAEVCFLHWNIGKRIKEDVLYNQRAEYGKEIVKNLAVLLTEKYGKGWGYEKLKHCVRSAYTFTEDEIGYAVRTQLTWTVIIILSQMLPIFVTNLTIIQDLQTIDI